MKEKIKVFLKKLTNILLLIVSCLLVAAMVFIQSKQMNTLSASAEEASTVADVESGIDLTQYPSANLIPYPYRDGNSKTSVGVTFTVQSDCSILMNGTASNNSVFYIYHNDLANLSLEVGKTYTFGTFGKVGQYYAQINYRESGIDKSLVTSLAGYRHSFTLSEDWQLISIYIVVLKNATVDNVVFSPMLNVGDIEYPYIPPLDAIYNGGYDNGYNQGKEEGLDYARAGYWCDVTVGVRFKGTSNGAEVSNGVNELVFYPTVTSNGIDLTEVYTKLNTDYPNLILEDFSFTLYFLNPVVCENLQFRCIGDAAILVDDTLSEVLYDPVTEEYEIRRARFAYIDGSSIVSGLQTEMTSETEWDTLKFKQICALSCTSVQNISQLKGLRFYTADSLAGVNYEAGRIAGYNAGSKESYEAGKTEGFKLGKEEGFETGKSEGYESGKDDGYNKGLKEGELIGREKAISEGVDGSGLLYALFALLKLFFTLLSDMMSLKIAGDFTVGFFVIGIPATFMIINLVIKLVNRSSGGSE